VHNAFEVKQDFVKAKLQGTFKSKPPVFGRSWAWVTASEPEQSEFTQISSLVAAGHL